MSEYTAIFEDIDRALSAHFGGPTLPFRIIGRSALEMAGMPEGGTKDIDALEEFLKLKTLSDERLQEIEAFLKVEFGKGSPGERRHGLYLDLVEKGIAWLPQRPRFVDEMKLKSISVSRLHPVDVCVSKTFSHFKSDPRRGQDRTDVLTAIDAELVDVVDYARLMGKALEYHEMQSGVEEFYPKIIRFIEDDIIAKYGDPSIRLKYALPPWMENA